MPSLPGSSIDEALEQIRAAAPSNGDYLDDLQERLTAPQPIPLVPFIGAGLSMPMGFPSWPAFLQTLAAECGRSAEVATLLGESKYEEAAEAVESGLSSAIFHKRVTHTFGERKSNACELCGSVLALPAFASGPVITTNFDRILERVFAEAGRPFEHIAWGSQVDSIRSAMNGNRPFLLKIHGDAEDRTARVLTQSEYDSAYASTGPNSLRAQLARLFQSRTLLFIGCSLGPDRTTEVLLELAQQASVLEHFAIVEKPASDDEFFRKQSSLGERGILPIWYPHGRHHLIEPLLRWIAALQPSRRAPANELVLERPSQRRKEIRNELDLLIPYQRTTAFIGREREFEQLWSWLRSEVPVSVRVITGGGGSGKTRLAVELIESLETDAPGHWNCGFLTLQEVERFSRLENLSRWRRQKAVLAVVDYAAGFAVQLKPWLEQLSAAADSGERFRLLLLERDASLETGWLSSMLTSGYSTSAVRALFDPPEPVHLAPVTSAEDRRSLLRATVQAGAAIRNIAAPAIPAPGVDLAFDKRIDEPQWGDPLMLMMAGLTALDTKLVEALSFARVDLANELAKRELDRIVRFAGGAPPALLHHVAAYVTASGGLSRDELRGAAKAESEAIGLAHPSGWRALADSVAEALPATEGGAAAVVPDVIGEALLLRVWGGAEVNEGSRAVVRAAQSHLRHLAASVIRCAQDFCVGESPRSEPLAWLDALIEAAKNIPVFLRSIEAELPSQTLALRERAVNIDTRLLKLLDGGPVYDPATPPDSAEPEVLPERARVLHNLGVRLSDLGRREEALEATREAVTLRRQLSAQRPDAFLPDLAMALNNLGLRLSGLGRREEALEATREAVTLYRQLSAQRPDAFLPDLALSLNNLGMMLSNLGRREEALEATREAVTLYRQLSAQRPDAFLPDLAGSLNNLGVRLSGLGRREEALEATREAVTLRRQLSAQRPDAFLPDLATSLNNLGAMLSNLGRREEALEATREAVTLYRQLSAQRPDAFLPDLARSLNNLGLMLSNLGRREEALEATREAVTLYRQLSSQRPDAFLPDLARSLGACGAVMRETGDLTPATCHFHDGIQSLKPLFLRLPGAFEALMRTLIDQYLSTCQDASIQPDPALLSDILPILTADQTDAADA